MPNDPKARSISTAAPVNRSLTRRLVRWGLRAVLALLVLLAVLLAAGYAWEQVASSRFADDYPPPGQLVTLADGRSLHVVVKGGGEPTLVLESGAGGAHTDWFAVFDELAETTRVIAYDRAGYGWSDPSQETGITGITADLHAALEALDVSGPLVLVGHSIGGVYVRHYASLHPENIAGLVFVDSSHEEQAERMPPAVVRMLASIQSMASLAATGARFGLLRALYAVGAHPMLPAGGSERYAAMMNRSTVLSALSREYENIPDSMAQSRAVAVSFDELPILVLSATEPPRGLPPDMEQHVDAMQSLSRELQAELAALSTNARHLWVPDAGHYVQFDQPDVVVKEITAMIEAIRSGERLAPELVPVAGEETSEF